MLSTPPPDWLRALPLTRLTFVAHALAPTHLPAAPGLALHGMLGWALKAALCPCIPLDAPDVPGAHHPGCRYQRAFHTLVEPEAARALGLGQDAPRPLLVRAPTRAAAFVQPGEVFGFEVVLVGQAYAEAGAVVSAVQAWADRRGLGDPPQRFAVLAVTDGAGVPLLPPAGPYAAPFDDGPFDGLACAPTPEAMLDESAPDAPLALLPPLDPRARWRATLHTRTPLVLRQRLPGDTTTRDVPLDRIGNLLGPDVLLMPLVRRLHRLARLYGTDAVPDRPEPVSLDGVRVGNNTLALASHIDVIDRRFRTRGYAGRLVLDGLRTDALALLWAGQYLHVGSRIAFGYGQYDLDVQQIG